MSAQFLNSYTQSTLSILSAFRPCLFAVICVALAFPAESVSQQASNETDAVLAIQEDLIELGYDPGTPDGQMGRNTRNAILTFQKDMGLPETGEITPELVSALANEHARRQRDAEIESLAAALRRGETTTVKDFFERVDDMEALRDRPEFPLALRRAVGEGNTALVELLTEKGFTQAANVTSPPLLHLALERPKPELIRVLVEHVDSLDPLDDKSRTPLVRALHEDHIEAALILIDAGADIHTRATKGVTPLHFAAYRGHLEVMERLLSEGADPAVRDEVFVMTPAELAIKTLKWPTVDRLLQVGPPPRADIDAFDAVLVVDGQYGPSGLVELADSFGVRELSYENERFLRSSLLVKAPGGEPYRITFKAETDANQGGISVRPGSTGRVEAPGKVSARIDLGDPGSLLAASGFVGADRNGNDEAAVNITGLIVGPEGTLRGSHVVGTNGPFQPTSAATMDAAGISKDLVPDGAVLFTVGDALKLERLD